MDACGARRHWKGKKRGSKWFIEEIRHLIQKKRSEDIISRSNIEKKSYCEMGINEAENKGRKLYHNTKICFVGR